MKFRRKDLCIPYVVFLVLFVIFPIIVIFYYAFFDDNGYFTFQSVINFFSDSNKLNVMINSLMFSILNTLICLLIGYPIAYILANRKYNKNYVLVMLFVTPMWINFVLRTWATRDVLTMIGIGGGTHPYLATMIGLVYNYLPFVILPLYSTMLKLDKSQIEASIDLGCNRFQMFTKSIIPQTVPGIVSAAMMVFMPTMSSFVISDVLSEGKITLLGNSIFISFSQSQWGDGSFLAIIMLIIVFISMFLTRNYTEKDQGREAKW